MKALWQKIVGVFKTYVWAKWVALGAVFVIVASAAVVALITIDPKKEDSSIQESSNYMQSSDKEESSIDSSSIDEHIHSYVDEITKMPSCISKGEKTFTCECGANYTETLNYTSHNYQNGFCMVCGAVDPDYENISSSSESEHEHSYVEEITEEATCTTKGEKTFTCECGDTYTEEIGYLSHDYKDGFCAICGLVDPNHSYKESTLKAATCLESGIRVFSCPCGETYTENIPALGHDIRYRAAQDPSCVNGWEAHEYCARCDYTTIVELPALGHDWEYIAEVEPTCTEIGWTAYEQCVRCSEYKNNNPGEEVPALGHVWEYVEKVEPTCTEIGWTAYEQCTRCYQYRDEQIKEKLSALGHVWIYTAEVEPTCTETGWAAYKQCARCQQYNNNYAGEELPALGHIGGEATCLLGKICIRCGVEYTSALGHDWEYIAEVEPTCTEIGWTAYEQCTRCQAYNDEYAGEEIPELGHIGGEATCLLGNICTRCGVEYTSARGHFFRGSPCVQPVECLDCGVLITADHNWKIVAEKEPTCTATGWTEFERCEVCHQYKDGYEGEEIPVLEHNFIDGKCEHCGEAE